MTSQEIGAPAFVPGRTFWSLPINIHVLSRPLSIFSHGYMHSYGQNELMFFLRRKVRRSPGRSCISLCITSKVYIPTATCMRLFLARIERRATCSEVMKSENSETSAKTDVEKAPGPLNSNGPLPDPHHAQTRFQLLRSAAQNHLDSFASCPKSMATLAPVEPQIGTSKRAQYFRSALTLAVKKGATSWSSVQRLG